ncbi:MAG: TetR/AcrR family transcriptional regulator C-terminal domain-containing protein [Catonella sp.]|nr:TetR/AcrR family transcriptional regulator C-terminal domain-containing protein [Catonella sp.]MDY6357014.1 TetR/AcrR family transcriptional regulator C-terminal domain-containing protein [Catonella sp.]
MEKKELTKQLLGESFRNLLDTTPFEKITIRMITDAAGVIRPTFYHYFKDKYEVVEWIFEEEIGNPVKELIKSGLYREAAKMLFVKIDENREYYKKIFEVEGQNSFTEVLERDIYDTLSGLLKEHKIKHRDWPRVLSDDIVAKYYTMITVNVIRSWVENGKEVKTSDLLEAYGFLLTHSATELADL